MKSRQEKIILSACRSYELAELIEFLKNLNKSILKIKKIECDISENEELEEISEYYSKLFLEIFKLGIGRKIFQLKKELERENKKYTELIKK